MAAIPGLSESASPSAFTAEQKEYLAGFMAGVMASHPLPFVGATAGGLLTADAASSATPNLAQPDGAAAAVFGTPVGDLCREERWKYDENPLDAWDRLLRHAEEDRSPDAEHTYRFKTFGLFYVAPAQDSFMLRLRVPACELTAAQLHGVADLARDFGGGCAHITTRGNLQVREFKPRDIVRVLMRVDEIGLTSRGAGADNIRNVTASPDSGFAPDELIDVRPYAKGLHHYILNHRDLYGLPRKFNVAWDNGGSLSVAADTNDIGFVAVTVSEGSLAAAPVPAASAVKPGVYFRLQLGGITGHRDFAADTGLLVPPDQAVAITAAMIRVYLENGDRTNRKQARLKYLLGRWGTERFLEETQRKLAFPLVRLPLAACEPRRPVRKHGWLGPRPQAQEGLSSLGVGVPVGRLTVPQMHALADLATQYGRGELRLTVWQSLLLPHLPNALLETVKRAVHRMGLSYQASPAAGGVIACTGNRGCKYSAADTKGHATALIQALAARFPEFAAAVNIHFTGCAHSCAQHYCGDIGFIGAKLADGTEGYHVVLGGGMDDEQGIGRELFRGVRASDVDALVGRILAVFAERRATGETFVGWVRRHSVEELQASLAS